MCIDEKSNQPKVFTILVNYNGLDDTIECVKSLKRTDYPDNHIIIVENGSKDIQAIRSNQFLNGCAHIIISETNLGFAGANNLAVQYGLERGADYFLLLNNDTIVTADFLSVLVNASEEYDSDLTTGNIACFNQRECMWYSNGDYDPKTGICRMVVPVLSEEKIRDVSFCTGCLMLIDVKCIKKYGLLDESYFMYGEDTDYCCRILKNGGRIICCSESLIYHKESASAGKNSPFQIYYITRNDLFLISRYGNNNFAAYVNRIGRSLRPVLRGYFVLRPVIDAISDFVRGRTGRNCRY